MKRIAYVEISGEHPIRCLMPDELAAREGDECIVENNRAIECGVILRFDTADDGATSGFARVLRRATLQDMAQKSETALRSRMVKQTCEAKAEKYKLPIRLVRVRYTFDRSILKIIFAADEKIDFREMAKDLSDELKVKIEIKQVGVRDEAGTIGGVGTCGRLLCCCSWLRSFESVNVKMAKNQQLSLNPASISGLCGRLKCCLRFENDVYRELSRNLPKEGDIVETPEGRGTVIARDILKGNLKIELDDKRFVNLKADEVDLVQFAKNQSVKKNEEEISEEILEE